MYIHVYICLPAVYGAVEIQDGLPGNPENAIVDFARVSLIVLNGFLQLCCPVLVILWRELACTTALVIGIIYITPFKHTHVQMYMLIYV